MYKDGNPAFHSHPFGQAWHDKSAAVTMPASTQVAKTTQNLKSKKTSIAGALSTYLKVVRDGQTTAECAQALNRITFPEVFSSSVMMQSYSLHARMG